MNRLFAPLLSALIAFGLFAALLTACQESEAQDAGAGAPALAMGQQDCGSKALQALIGQKSGILAEHDLPQPHRILSPNSIMTMDYRSERLNIYLDRHGVIEKISCG